MTRYYIGIDEDGQGEVFGWDERHEPTPEETGFEAIAGPYETEKDAKEAL